MSSTTLSGLVSGIDSTPLLKEIKKNQQMRLQPHIDAEASNKAKCSAWDSIATSLQSLNKTVKTLQNDSFNNFDLNSCESFKATATSAACADTYNIRVSQLATAHKLITKPLEVDVPLGSEADSRTLVISQKTGITERIVLRQDETSLKQLAKVINQQASHVTASTQLSDDGYQLILSARQTGTSGEITVQVEDDIRLQDILSTHSGMKNLIAAQDAKLDINSIKYTRESNYINDTVPGVNLQLKAISEKDESLTLTQNTISIKKDIQDFVKQYNNFMMQCSSLSRYKPAESSTVTNKILQMNTENGALMGNTELRGLVNEIRYTVNDVYGEAGAHYSSLADLGIKMDALTGLMTLDTGVLDSVITTQYDDVRNIFIMTKNKPGLASQIDKITTRYSGDSENKTQGVIKDITKNLYEQVEKIKKQRDNTQRLIDTQMKFHTKQFQMLEITMSKLNKVNAQLVGLERKK
jgi:flagellar hook-associated protein 2